MHMTSHPFRYAQDSAIRLWLMLVVALLLVGLVQGPGVPQHFDIKGVAIGRDFVNIWASARMIRDGRADELSDATAFQSYINGQMGREYESQNWSYPPTLQTLILPFAYLPYLTGFFLWLAITFLPLLMAVRGYGWGWGTALILFLAPAGIWNIFTGQQGFLAAGLLALGLQTRKDRPWIAACAFALLTMKPHLGLFIPLLLVIERNWKLIGRTAMLAVAWVVLSLLVFGSHGWIEYLTTVRSYQWDVLTKWEGFVLYIMPSAWMAGRLLALPELGLWVVQGLCSAAAILLAVRAFLKTGLNDAQQCAALMFASLLVLPYFFYYDMMIFQVALLLVWRRGQPLGSGWWVDVQKLTIWCLPFLAFIGTFFAIQITPLVLLALLWRVQSPPRQTV